MSKPALLPSPAPGGGAGVGRTKRFTTAEFITKAQAKHGVGTYDYSRVVYTNSNSKVTIICPTHGPFEQKAGQHLTCACTKCASAGRALGQQAFIERARCVHGDKYDYSQTVYVSSKKKLTIICPQHGAFQQAPIEHNSGKGCRHCGVSRSNDAKRYTAELFIKKAQTVHGVGTYDYSQVMYINAKAKVNIICSQHGLFKQTPDTHVAGSGCPCCGDIRAANARLDTKSQFIEKAQTVHGVGTYDYSKAIYTLSTKKLTIICPQHGAFQQAPVNHIGGNGCPRCAQNRRSDATRLSTAQFIAKAEDKHGVGTYDYSQVAYIGNSVNVVIICSVHGPFKQTPSSHLSGSGCIKCAGNIVGNTAGFIIRAHSRHGDKYNYSRSEYVGAHTKVIITCPVHGEFEQTPNAHCRGAGCPTCAKESRSLSWITQAGERPATLYLIRIYGGGENFYKVGITIGTVKERYSSIRDMPKPYAYEIMAQHTSNAVRIYDWEQSILETFAHLRYKPIRQFGGATECFSGADEILAIFPL